MKVHGHEITQELQDACWEGMAAEFSAQQIKMLLINNGLPADAAFWGADRLCQKWRQVGFISYDRRKGLWVKEV